MNILIKTGNDFTVKIRKEYSSRNTVLKGGVNEF